MRAMRRIATACTGGGLVRASSTVESAGRLPRGNALAALALTLHLVLPLALVAAGTLALGADAVRWGHALMSAWVATLAVTLLRGVAPLHRPSPRRVCFPRGRRPGPSPGLRQSALRTRPGAPFARREARLAQTDRPTNAAITATDTSGGMSRTEARSIFVPANARTAASP